MKKISINNNNKIKLPNSYRISISKYVLKTDKIFDTEYRSESLFIEFSYSVAGFCMEFSVANVSINVVTDTFNDCVIRYTAFGTIFGK